MQRLSNLKHLEQFGGLGISLCFLYSSQPCLQEGITEVILVALSR